MAFILKCVSNGSRFTRRGGWRGLASQIVYSDEIREAKAAGKAIVALESTIITHGMPYPQNLNTALQVENIIRDRGAVPATIAILKGQITVGLTKEQIESLAQAKGVVKASRRDLAPIIARKLDGATTVAGTIIAAELADIPIFVTGGIGGVHREGETTMDISADLNELGRSKTLVVCSGVKSILDIGRTLEYLETQGVCVCAFGETHDFPAFYTQKSGHLAPHRVSDATEAAELLVASHNIGLSSGIVVAVPLPKEQAMDETKIATAINKALQIAKERGIQGKEVTPFILSAVAEATEGASLAANIALIKNNAKVGADIAVAHKKLRNVSDSKSAFNIGGGLGKCSANSRRQFHSECERRAREARVRGDQPPLFSAGDVLVIGGANVDRTYRTTEPVHLDGSTHPCLVGQCAGGVGRNVAEALWRLRAGRARLLTAIGDDTDGKYLASIAPNLILDGCVVKDARTATYAAVVDPRGECLLGLGDMAIHDLITVDMVNKHLGVLERAPLVVIDGNLPQATINHVLQLCHNINKPVFFEPTDKRKAAKALQENHSLAFTSPNIIELRSMACFLKSNNEIEQTGDITEILELGNIVLDRVSFIIVTMGAKGVATISRNNRNETILKLYPVQVLKEVENVSGAGDCFTSGFITGMLLDYNESRNVCMGFEAAKMALRSKLTVPRDLSIDDTSISEIIYTKFTK